MQYRLRTLLIVVSLAGLLLARVAYLKHKADFHRGHAAALISSIAAREQREEDAVAYAVYSMIHLRPSVALQAIREAPHDGSYWDGICSAMSHELIARKYDKAVYRPWTLVADIPSY
jgi:hypothetical protein